MRPHVGIRPSPPSANAVMLPLSRPQLVEVGIKVMDRARELAMVASAVALQPKSLVAVSV
jgi:hypothetical protein